MNRPLVSMLALLGMTACRSAQDSGDPAAKKLPPEKSGPSVTATDPTKNPTKNPTLVLEPVEALALADGPEARVAVVVSTPKGPVGLAAVVREATLHLRAFGGGETYDVFTEQAGSIGVNLDEHMDGTVVVIDKNLDARQQEVGALLGYRATSIGWDATRQRLVVRERWACTETTSDCETWPAWTDASTKVVNSVSPTIEVQKPAPAVVAEVNADSALDRPPTPAEIERCARLYVITAACGLTDDFELGWMKADKKKLSVVEAKAQCSVSTIGMGEGGRELPVKLLATPALDTLEKAASAGCADLRKALDKIDPRLGEAGSEP